MATNSLSPISPTPGTIIPRSFTLESTAPTHTSTPSGQQFAARLIPCSEASTLSMITFCTPQSRSRRMAASAVAPVAITGSSSTASVAAAVLAVGSREAGEAGESSDRWKGRLL